MPPSQPTPSTPGPSAAQPLVSILTPCWNAAPFLHETYNSLRGQTYSSWEWVVADDGSTDDSLRVLASIAAADPRVRLLALPHSGLPAVGRNAALREARGAYLAFLDADDLFESEKLQRQVALLQSDTTIGLTCCDARDFHTKPEEDLWRQQPVWRSLSLPRKAFSTLLRGNTVCTSSIFMRREVFERIGEFDESPHLRAVEDWDYVLRVAKEFDIVKTPGILVHYRTHPGNLSQTLSVERTEALMRRLEQRGDLRGTAGRRFKSNFYVIRAELALAGVREGSWRRDFLRAFSYLPGSPARWVGLLGCVLPQSLTRRLYGALLRLKARLTADEFLKLNPLARK